MLALTIANLKMMVRNRQTTFWALFFPLVLVVVFGLFDFTATASSNIAVIDSADTPASLLLVESFAELEAKGLLDRQEQPSSLDEGRRLVADGDLDFLLSIPPDFGTSSADIEVQSSGQEGLPGSSADRVVPVTLLLGGESEERNQLVIGMVRQSAQISSTIQAAGLDEENQRPAATPVGAMAEMVQTERLATQSATYFEMVLLGLVAMGIMTHGTISIAVRISNYRNLSILKRMLVTPLPIWKFFAAEVTAQLLLAVVQAAVILAVGVFLFGAQIDGNVLHMLPAILLGSAVFLNFGFIISAWANTPAAASGMGNVVTLPMMFFAGTFFSTSALPWLLPYAADALPLAPMITAMRDIGLRGATAWEVWPQLAWLAGWVAATAVVAVRVFRFS